MPVHLRAPPEGPIVVRERELWPPDEAEFSLAYRRLVAMLRLARVVEDQLGVDAETAARIAAALLSPTTEDDGCP